MWKPVTLAACLAAPLAAGAQSTEDTRLPEDAWRTEFIGRYAVEGACEDDARTWLLNESQVRFGSEWCTALGKLTWEEDGLAVPMSECRDGAVEADDRRLVFYQAEDGLTVDTGEQTLALTDCGSSY
ncbi:hypothetical protein [Histidinibacterium aquaticum]|uniref:DUF3617 family protein n=1 Tax=Histidinibacterium aquaticum TaxID=2613962 RepID=A0A5J5GJ41_9RHOB|nr:hypothetical protein [Histidinibacterium aquaticum]KAA9008246.1 hypothetical protein F3S47_12215 [Histidinibacterium aquaticum]